MIQTSPSATSSPGSSRFPISRRHIGKREDPGEEVAPSVIVLVTLYLTVMLFVQSKDLSKEGGREGRGKPHTKIKGMHIRLKLEPLRGTYRGPVGHGIA